MSMAFCLCLVSAYRRAERAGFGLMVASLMVVVDVSSSTSRRRRLTNARSQSFTVDVARLDLNLVVAVDLGACACVHIFVAWRRAGDAQVDESCGEGTLIHESYAPAGIGFCWRGLLIVDVYILCE